MKRIVVVGLGVLLLGILVWALWPAPAPVSVVTATRGPFVEYVEEEGRTDLRSPYAIRAPISGYLRRVVWEVGDEVEAGAVLFQLESLPAPALDARTREQAQQTVDAAKARVEATEAEWRVRQADRSLAERELARGQSLFEQQLITEAEFDRFQVAKDRAVSAEQSARSALDVATFEWRNAKAVLSVEEGRRGDEQQRVLEVAAPFDGHVLSRLRWDEGPIQAGEPVLELGDLRQLEVRVDLLSMDAVRVSEGMRVELTRWGGEQDLPARVRRVEPSGIMRLSALGVEEQRVPVLVQFESPREEWASLGKGFRVEARFILWESDDVMQIPVSALFREGDEWSVFVVDEGRARLRTVEPGRRSRLWSQVLEGLDEGEMVVIHPGDHIRDGSRVDPDVRPYR